MHIYYLPIRSQIWNETDTNLLEYVSTTRREKVQRYMHISDQKLSLYAGLLARMELSQLSGISHSQLQFEYKDNHKPRFLSAPSFDFSLSHTYSAILCCISSDKAVGADIEKINDPPYEVMKNVFHPEEIQYVDSAPINRRANRFFEIWTRKEAYTKYLGVGLIYDLLSCNTLASTLSAHLFTWQQEDYLCSVYGDTPDMNNVKVISEREIHRYFLENDI